MDSSSSPKRARVHLFTADPGVVSAYLPPGQVVPETPLAATVPATQSQDLYAEDTDITPAQDPYAEPSQDEAVPPTQAVVVPAPEPSKPRPLACKMIDSNKKLDELLMYGRLLAEQKGRVDYLGKLHPGTPVPEEDLRFLKHWEEMYDRVLKSVVVGDKD